MLCGVCIILRQLDTLFRFPAELYMDRYLASRRLAALPLRKTARHTAARKVPRARPRRK